MRLIATVFVMMVATAMTTLAQTGAEAEVRALERRWLDAYETHSTKEMDAIVAPDFLITFPNGGKQSKPQIMSMISRPVSANKTRFRTEKVEAAVYGDTVILRGIVVNESERDGKTVSESQSYTDTYLQRNGKWQVVASHLSEVPKARTAPAPKID